MKHIGEPIDRKFLITATCREHDHEHTEMDSMLFLAKDKALPATLEFYRAECIRVGAAPEQIKAVELMIERVKEFQRVNPTAVKVPDVDIPGGEFIIDPNRF